MQSTEGQKSIFSSFAHILCRYGLSKEEASKRFFIVDKDGLISKSRYIISLCLSNCIYANISGQI